MISREEARLALVAVLVTGAAMFWFIMDALLHKGKGGDH